jgi:hypothetical protein
MYKHKKNRMSVPASGKPTVVVSRGTYACRDRRSTQGAVMLVVLMIIMVATATATMAVQSTNFELRSSGYGRRETQTKYVSEAALSTALGTVESAGPQFLIAALNKSDPPVMGNFNEPELDTGKGGYRIYSSDYSGLTPPPVAGGDDGTLGPKQAYEPWFAVDIYDQYSVPAVVAGYRTDGNSPFAFMNATFVARGFTVPAGATPLSSGAVNQSANTSCGCAQSGPYPVN